MWGQGEQVAPGGDMPTRPPAAADSLAPGGTGPLGRWPGAGSLAAGNQSQRLSRPALVLLANLEGTLGLPAPSQPPEHPL